MRVNREVLPALWFTVVTTFCVALPVQAGEWKASAGVAPAVTYSDNICLASEDEQGEWVGLVSPDVAVSGSGRRANLKLSARVEFNTLSDSDLEDLGCNPSGFGNRKQFAPRLRANADAILIEDWLFLDADASANQNSTNPFVAGGGDSLNTTGNTNTTYRYSASPYIARRFKDVADLNLRYRWGDQYNTEERVGDSSRQSVQLELGSGAFFSPLSWALRGDYSKVKYENRPGRDGDNSSELKSARVELGYQVSNKWQVNGYYGEEWNDFVSASDEIDGDFWDIGVRWTPNVRTTIEAGTGQRFFGDTPRLSIDYRHKRILLYARYDKDLTYDRNIRTIEDPLSQDGVLDPVVGPDGTVSGNVTTISTSPILDERFTLGMQIQGRRTTVSVRASHSDQTRTSNLSESTFRSAVLSANHSLGRNLSISASVGWDERKPRTGIDTLFRASETWTATVGARRQLSSNMSLLLDYRYRDRQSDGSSGLFGQNYQENRITLTLRFEF